ncbi:MAG: deoxyguanosinetriphosphate triphosphohydrolase [Alphaproteobacteria bacterium]|nr:deoxyguanosinetriphosphate triphosphohydrolase [Alphaproteobacteria bacterium]
MAVGFAYAPFASHPDASRGRLHAEPESATRSVFQRDRDRIIHSTAFRRLKQKTQVFIAHEGDHYRTRLTHSLEVAQIARSISRVLGLDEDLAEALALAHDLGHTPFGHAGEDALDTVMLPYGGFDHNAQTLRILTKLEQRYAEFDGLNLTWETLEGVVKHNGPLLPSIEKLPAAIAEYAAGHDLELDTYPSAEAQVAALSDDIAYNSHDIEDGLRAEMFSIDDLVELPLIGPIINAVTTRYAALQQSRLVHELTRRMINRMVDDCIAETRRRVAAAGIASAAAVRALPSPVAAFSAEMKTSEQAVRAFLHARLYNHFQQKRSHRRARRIVAELFAVFIDEPGCLPTEWQTRLDASGATDKTARLIADYIAGMTDRFALDEHRRLCGQE